jgi:hypothetical protein
LDGGKPARAEIASQGGRISEGSCPFLPFSKKDTFTGSGSVSIHEFNASSLQSAPHRLHGFVRNQSSFSFKIDNGRQAQLGGACELRLGDTQESAGGSTLGRRH